MKAKELAKIDKKTREKKLKELKMELVKAQAGASKAGSSKVKNIKKIIARILTLNNAKIKSAELNKK